jgi:hypothetical protein
MNIFKLLYCALFGHKSSIFSGISAPLVLAWAYPDKTKPPAPPPPSQQSMGYGVSGIGRLLKSVPTVSGPAYSVDLCQRCLTLYVSPPPPICANCSAVEHLHKEGFCATPCESCGKPREVHLDGKCPFEASNYKGTRWAKSTRSACP